jgi:GNAT superfamily N-acetyltransferase
VRIVSISDIPDEQLVRALTRIEARDPLISPLNRHEVRLPHGLAALDDDGEILGLGWLRHREALTEIDVRVEPPHRRQGVGSRLYSALDDAQLNLVASCDPAQKRAVRFLEARGFEMKSVLFARRWDGEKDDVPPAFRSAQTETPADRPAAWRILVDAMNDSWPGPSVEKSTFLNGPVRVREARMGEEVVGVLVALEGDDAWSLGGMGVLPAYRKRGVGRVLLCEQMRVCAEAGKGLVLHVAHDNESFLEWTRNLGFWTFRTWAIFERAPSTG